MELFFTWALLGFAPQRSCPGVNSSLCEEWTNLSVLVAWVSLKHQYFAHPASGHSVTLIVGRMEKIGTM